jgi:hypothetical protein
VRTWNGQISWIVELSEEFSVANAVAGGIFHRNAGLFGARSGPMVL